MGAINSSPFRISEDVYRYSITCQPNGNWTEKETCGTCKSLNVFDRKIVDNWCKTMLFKGITHRNKNVVNRKTIGLY